MGGKFTSTLFVLFINKKLFHNFCECPSYNPILSMYQDCYYLKETNLFKARAKIN